MIGKASSPGCCQSVDKRFREDSKQDGPSILRPGFATMQFGTLAPTNITSDETVVMFPSLGHLEEDGRTWRVLVHTASAGAGAQGILAACASPRSKGASPHAPAKPPLTLRGNVPPPQNQTLLIVGCPAVSRSAFTEWE